MILEDLYLQGFEADIKNAQTVGQSFFVWNHEILSKIQDKIDASGLSVYKWGKAMGMPYEYPYIIGNVK